MTIPNKFPVICAALAAVAATSAGFAQSTAEIYSGTVSLSQASNYSGGDGEFTAFGLPVPGVYAASALYGGALETFCVEDSTYFWQSNAFYGSSFAVNYSEFVEVPTPDAWLGNQNSPYDSVALNPDVAWLYAQFATGSFTGGLVVNSNVNAGALQDAIWGAPRWHCRSGPPDNKMSPFSTYRQRKQQSPMVQPPALTTSRS